MAATASEQEQRVLEAVHDAALHRRRVARRAGGATLDVEDPATGETLAEVADATRRRRQGRAGRRARDVPAPGATVPPRERGDILRRAYDLIIERADDLALLMTLEMGKPVAESKAEIAYAANFFRWYAEEAVRIDGRFTVNETGAGRVLTMQQPVGPCLFITPWNFPLAMGTRKIGPAIAAGLHDGRQAGQADAAVDARAGPDPRGGRAARRRAERHHGEVVGRGDGAADQGPADAQAVASPARPRSGARSSSSPPSRSCACRWSSAATRPFLVFDDADLDAAVEGALIAKMRNMRRGVHAAPTASTSHDAVAGEFAEQLAERMGALKVGRGTEPDVQVGPLIDDDQRGKVAELVEDAVAKGREGALRRRAHRRRRLLLRSRPSSPTCPTTRGCSSEEIFGPVAPVKSVLLRGRGDRRAPTTPSTASSPTSTRRTSTARSASSRGSRPG